MSVVWGAPVQALIALHARDGHGLVAASGNLRVAVRAAVIGVVVVAIGLLRIAQEAVASLRQLAVVELQVLPPGVADISRIRYAIMAARAPPRRLQAAWQPVVCAAGQAAVAYPVRFLRM